MIPSRSVLATTAALVLVFGGVVAALFSGSAHAATTTLCSEQTAPVGGSYIVQNNEYDSSASECVTTDGNADFTVANSSISNSTSGSPGAYPSIYQGCHWGNCSSGGLTTTPIQVSNLTTGKVTTNWSTTQPGGSSDYDVAYDIWFNQTPTTTGQPNGTELMVWLNHNGPVQPFGSEVASNVSLGGHTYNIWEGTQSSWDTVTYDMTSGATSVSGLDIGTLTQDMVSRGYTKSSWYLIDVEAGFELWQGGAGLETNSFSVNINGSSATAQSPPPTTPPPTTPADPPPPTHPAHHTAADQPAPERLDGLHRHVLRGQQLARWLPGTGRGQEHRLWNLEQLAARLPVPQRQYDQQPVEWHVHPVGRDLDGHQCLVRRNARAQAPPRRLALPRRVAIPHRRA